MENAQRKLLALTLSLLLLLTANIGIVRADDGSKEKEELLARIAQLEALLAKQARQLETLEKVVAEAQQSKGPAANETESSLSARIADLERQLKIQDSQTVQQPVAASPAPQNDAASSSSIQSILDNKLNFHGAFNFAYAQTNGNDYSIGNKSGNYDSGNFILTMGINPYDKIFFNSQLNFASKQVELDWAFVELRQSDALRFRFGRVKHPLGLYGEVREIGTIRPLLTLPQGIYGQAGFAAKAYKGLGVTGSLGLGGGWSMDYDVYGGELDIDFLIPNAGFLKLSDVVGEASGADDGDGDSVDNTVKVEIDKVTDVVGARLMFQTPVNGLRFGMSSYRGREKADTQRHTVLGFSGEYLADKWTVRSEVFKLKDTFALGALASYVEVARMLTKNWQVAARYDRSTNKFLFIDPKSEFASVVKHRDKVIGLNYVFNSNLVMKFGFHRVNGNLFAKPQVKDGVLIDGFRKNTNMFETGIQFAF
ncbi:MAG: hypothetical protein AB1489_12170 [Acidobacteriota bacterium]